MATPAQTLAKLKAAQAQLVKDTAALQAANPRPVALTDAQYDRKKAAEAAAAAADAAAKQKAKDEAAANATATAASINAMGITGLSSKVNPTTGMVETTTPPKPTPVSADPNANKAGFYLDPKTGKWAPIPERPVGTPPAFIWDEASGTYIQPAKPGGSDTTAWDNNKGWVTSTTIPGSTGFQAVAGINGAAATVSTKTLAFDTFKNTLALSFGPAEISKSWVAGVYKAVSGYYQTGSTVDESINLAVQEVRNNPDMADFTRRFAGLYALTDKLAAEGALVVPTVAEFVRSEAALGELLNRAGMGELATQEFTGKVLGLNKSVAEVGRLINDTFASIDFAPEELKKTLSTHFGNLSRVDLAKALLMGKEGAIELDNKIKGLSVLSAAGTQGSVIDYATASDIAKQGYGYKESLVGFGKVKELGRGKDLGNIYGEQVSDKETRDVVFGQNADALAKFDRLSKKEDANFRGQPGMTASSLRASRSI